MNAFEDIIKLYLEEQNYWVKQLVKINISKSEKRKIGLPSMPRPEIDIAAFDVKNNELLLVEVKSYLDSPGVKYACIANSKEKGAKRYRLLNDNIYRRIVTRAIKKQYLEKGLIKKNTKINYALAAGKIRSGENKDNLIKHFNKRGWKLFLPEQIKEQIKELSKKGWEDSAVVMTAKLILKK